MDDHPLSPNLGAAYSGNVEAIDYLEWYIPRLQAGVEHDLSQSGMHFHWDWESLLDGVIPENLTDPFKPPLNPRDLIAEREGVDPRRVTGGHGVSQTLLIALLASAKKEAPRRVAVEMPSYAPVSQFPRTLGYEVVPFHRGPKNANDCGPWEIDRPSLAGIIEDVCAVITTPMQNPSGWMMTPDDQLWLADICGQHRVPLISDEVYLDSAEGTHHRRPMHTYGDHCVSVNSLTKCYGLGPLRVGWLISSVETAAAATRALHTIQGMLATPSLRLAEKAWPHIDAPLEEIERRRAVNLPILLEMLTRNGIEWTPPPTGIFGCIPLPTGIDSQEFVENVCSRYGVLAIPCQMFSPQLSGFLRLAWGSDPDEFAAAVAMLDAALKKVLN